MYIVSDALRMPWRFGSHPSVCYCNPPYSNIDPWMAKAVEQLEFGVTTVMLAPSPNGESRFPKHVFGVCSEIVFISPRVSFLRPDGSVARGNSRGSCLYVWSPYFPGGQTAMRFVSIPT